MSKTFKDIYGEKYNLDYLFENYRLTLDTDQDIVSGEISGYCLLLDDERRIEIDESTYQAIKKII